MSRFEQDEDYGDEDLAEYHGAYPREEGAPLEWVAFALVIAALGFMGAWGYYVFFAPKPEVQYVSRDASGCQQWVEYLSDGGPGKLEMELPTVSGVYCAKVKVKQ